MIRALLLLLSFATLASAEIVVPAGRAPGIELLSGIAPDNRPTGLWLDMVRALRGGGEPDEGVSARRPLGGGERLWQDLITARAAVWSARRDGLAEPFRPVAEPASVRIVIGNRGGEDAFTHDARTIGFDVSRLEAEYGDARAAENVERIDRFFAHEYTHVLQRAWLPEHPQPDSTPFERAELAIWREGLGNYYSLSPRWRSRRDGQPARAALAELEPVFVRRMAALACATPAEEAELVADLSRGPFEKKWGALPAALWLESEARRSPTALREFVQGGVASVRVLAGRHLSAAARSELDAARARSRECSAPAAAATPG
jgi:hypothetical protein